MKQSASREAVPIRILRGAICFVSGIIHHISLPGVACDKTLLQTGNRITNCRERVARYCQGFHYYRSYDSRVVARDSDLREEEVRLANKLGARMGDQEVGQMMSSVQCVGAALKGIPANAAIWDEWDDSRQSALADLFGCLLGPGIGLPKATKVLHKKRPNLIPILDLNVSIYAASAATQRGARLPGWDEEARRGVALMGVLREDVRRNLRLLRKLGKEFGLSPLRVFDILIWSWSRE